MFRIYLPKPVYEHLPAAYLALAGLLVLLPLSPLRWIPVAALLLASWLTRRRRRDYRAAQRRDTIRMRVAERYGKASDTFADDEGVESAIRG